MRVLKLLVVVVILTVAGLIGYAYFGDMNADPTQMRVPVELDLGAEPAPGITAPDATAPAAPAETPAATASDEPADPNALD